MIHQKLTFLTFPTIGAPQDLFDAVDPPMPDLLTADLLRHPLHFL